MNAPLVSVMIITYNQLEFIRETLDSALNQDYENYEIVVADDGSTDGTAEVILEYAAKYPGKVVPLVGGENLGITGNGNRGLSGCKGELIAFMGGDDLFLFNKLSAQVKWFRDNPSGVICGHKLYLVNDKTEKIGEHPYRDISGAGPKEWIESGTLYGATSVMVKGSKIPSYGFDVRLPVVSDWKLYIDCLDELDTWGGLDQFLGMYRKHDGNITGNKLAVKPDMLKTLLILKEEKPKYLVSIKKAHAIKILYSEGCCLLLDSQYREALGRFLASLKYYPSNIKAYYRIMQCLIYSIVPNRKG